MAPWSERHHDRPHRRSAVSADHPGVRANSIRRSASTSPPETPSTSTRRCRATTSASVSPARAPRSSRARSVTTAAVCCRGANVVIRRNTGWSVPNRCRPGRALSKATRAEPWAPRSVAGCIHVKGNCGPRAGIAMKGGDIIVEGNVGYQCAFMAHVGRLIVLGNAGASTGDSLWNGEVWVAGEIGGLGVDTKVVSPDRRRGGIGRGDAGAAWARTTASGIGRRSCRARSCGTSRPATPSRG